LSCSTENPKFKFEKIINSGLQFALFVDVLFTVIRGKNSWFHETDNTSTQRQQGVCHGHQEIQIATQTKGIDRNDRKQGGLRHGNGLARITVTLGRKDTPSTQSQHGGVKAADGSQHVTLSDTAALGIVGNDQGLFLFGDAHQFPPRRQILAGDKRGRMDQTKGWQDKVFEDTHYV